MSVKKEYQILLIEDDYEYADHLRSLLDNQASHTFKYERVSRFSEASKLLRENRFDTILLDFGLKDMSGLDSILDLSNEAQNTPIIGMLDAVDESRANEAVEYGLDDRIIKNEYDEHVIVSKILFAIKRSEANQNNHIRQKTFTSESMLDSRSGLPNQILFNDRLEQAINRADRDQDSIGVLAISLEYFKPVNDQYGSKVGNAVLQKISKLLNQNIRKSDTVAHVDDDKFMVVLENLDKTSAATLLAERIIRVFSKRMHIVGHDFKMTASAGIAIYPDCNGMDLIKNAEQAMKRAEEMGGNRYKLYTENFSEEAIWKYQLENDLEKALIQQQFELHYQPLFDLKEQRVYGLEALLRWNHPEQGPLMPGAFIGELEKSDMIIEVGEWVLAEACKKLKLWQTKYPHITMSVNLTARQFEDPYLLERVSSILEKHEIQPQHIELEITERQVVDKDNSISQYNIQVLSDMGINLALDDFGTGYSTEAYFQHFPADTIQTLKIDRFDTKAMMEDEAVAQRVRSYIEFSREKNMRVIAEGIESEDQLEYIEQLGVNLIQGYLLSKPVSGSEIEDGLRRNDYFLEINKSSSSEEMESQSH